MFGLDAMTMFLISAALSVGSSIMQYQANQSAQRKQMQAIMAASDNQLEHQKKINQVIDEETKKYDPNARAADQAAIEGDMNTQYDAALAKAADVGYGGVNPSMQGAVSDVYLKDVADTTAKAGADATELARLMAKIGSGTRLRQNEAIRFNDVTQRVGLEQNYARGMAGTDDLRIKVAGQPNPTAEMLAGLLGGAGSAGMTYSLGSLNNGAGSIYKPFGLAAPVGVSQPMFYR